MANMSAIYSCLVFLVLASAVLSQQNRCGYEKGGQCVPFNRYCPNGLYMDAASSNYLYCNAVNMKCCVRNTRAVLPSCGMGEDINDKVLNGITTGSCDWPFSVSIRSSAQETAIGNNPTYDNTNHACGGVLIDRQWVLTSAFCVLSAGTDVNTARQRMLVVAGDYNISQIDIYPGDNRQQEQIFRVQRAIIHPSYPFSSDLSMKFDDPKQINSNNIALIKLDRPLRPRRCAGAACLPSQFDVNNDRLFYDECKIVGWGFTKAGMPNPTSGSLDILKMGSVKLTSAKACDFLTRRLNMNNKRPIGTICQAPRDFNTDSCLGDGGGAVLCYTKQTWVVRAILPFNMCIAKTFNLYVTEVAQYLRWIEETMRKY